MKKIKFDKDGYVDERFLEQMEDSGHGNLTNFYGTGKDEKKQLAKLMKRLMK